MIENLPFLLALGSSALIDSVNPCAFSVLLLTIAFLFSLGSSRGRVWAVGGTYIAGIFAAYLLIGFGLLRVLSFFSLPKIVADIGAILIIVAGLISLVNYLWPRFPLKLKIPNIAHSPIAKLMHEASLPTALLLGVLVGVTEFPCTGGPYLTAIGLLHDNATFWSGAAYLIVYNVIFVAPLILVLLLSGNIYVFRLVTSWKESKNGSLRLVSSLAMIVLGLAIIILQI